MVRWVRALVTGGLLALPVAVAACTATGPTDAAPTTTAGVTRDVACPSQRDLEDTLNTSIEMMEGMTSVEVVGDVICSGDWAVAPTQVHFGGNQVAPRSYQYILRRTSETWELSDQYLPAACSQLSQELAAVACAGTT